MSKLIKRITVVVVSNQPGPGSGTHQIAEIYRAKTRRVSKRLKPAEKWSRRIAQAIERLGSELLDRQERANKKRKNGWLKRWPYDFGRAEEKAYKRLMKP